MEIKPSTVLSYSMLTSRSFGIGTDTVDDGPNIVTIAIRDAKRRLGTAGVPEPTDEDQDYLDAC